MRYEAREYVVYDSEEETIVEQFNNTPEGCKAAVAAAGIANKNEREWSEFDNMMRSNRASGF